MAGKGARAPVDPAVLSHVMLQICFIYHCFPVLYHCFTGDLYIMGRSSKGYAAWQPRLTGTGVQKQRLSRKQFCVVIVSMCIRTKRHLPINEQSSNKSDPIHLLRDKALVLSSARRSDVQRPRHAPTCPSNSQNTDPAIALPVAHRKSPKCPKNSS